MRSMARASLCWWWKGVNESNDGRRAATHVNNLGPRPVRPRPRRTPEPRLPSSTPPRRHPAAVSLTFTSSHLSFLRTNTANMGGLLEQLDGAISDLLAGWNIYTSLITVGILGFVGWVVYDSADADTHPLLLARQAQASYVRQPGESAIFRSPETPHGCRCFD
jgi:hypothetical protein